MNWAARMRRICDALLVLHEFVGLEDGVELDEVDMYFWNNDTHLETVKLESLCQTAR